MEDRTRRLGIEELRASARAAAGDVLNPGDPGSAAETLGMLGMRGASSSALGSALWQIWGRIFEEWTRPDGDRLVGAQWARESALDMLEALGDPDQERAYCHRWIHDGRLGIAPSEPQ